MPNIENLKKQAKQYLRWHRGNGTIPSQPRKGCVTSVSRHGGHGDTGIKLQAGGCSGACCTANGVRQVAGARIRSRCHGADAPKQTMSRPVLTSIEVQLFVANIQSSCDFYTSKLGFAVAFVYGDPPFYGQVVRDCARLNLRLVGEPRSPAIFASAKVCYPLPSRLLP